MTDYNCELIPFVYLRFIENKCHRTFCFIMACFSHELIQLVSSNSTFVKN